jgi:glycerol-3-phosphate dehydrogenase
MNWLRRADTLESVAAIDDHLLDWPERITIDCILDAEPMGTVALNDTTAEGIERRGERWSIGLRTAMGKNCGVEARCALCRWRELARPMGDAAVGHWVQHTRSGEA